ncbi:MAG: hypothetical protein ACKODZ_10405 [Verrucomicrobiota bacterium]
MANGRTGLLVVALGVLSAGLAGAESYEEYVARHKRVQKMMNPMNVPVANVLNDAWNEYPEYADPNNKPAPQKGPKDFYIKSSRDDGRLKTR